MTLSSNLNLTKRLQKITVSDPLLGYYRRINFYPLHLISIFSDGLLVECGKARLWAFRF